jgi:hypothetical protein
MKRALVIVFFAGCASESSKLPEPVREPGAQGSTPHLAPVPSSIRLGGRVRLTWSIGGAQEIELRSDPEGAIDLGPHPPAGDVLSSPLDRDTVFRVVAAGEERVLAETRVRVGGRVERILTGLSSPLSLTSDGEQLYWTDRPLMTNRGAIVTARLDGSDHRTIHRSDEELGEIVYAGSGELFWIERWGAIVRSRADGSALAVIASDETAPEALTVDDHWVYWTRIAAEGSRREIVRALRDGSQAPSIVAPSIALGRAPIAVDETSVYFWQDEPRSRIVRAKTDGSEPEEIAPVDVLEMGHPVGLSIDGETLYLATQKRDRSGRTFAAMFELPRTGGAPEPAFEVEDEVEPGPPAVDADHLYWMQRHGLCKWKKDHSARPTLIAGFDVADNARRSIVITETHVYWALGGGATTPAVLERAPK